MCKGCIDKVDNDDYTMPLRFQAGGGIKQAQKRRVQAYEEKSKKMQTQNRQ